MKCTLTIIAALFYITTFSQGSKTHPLQKCFACHNGNTEAPFNWTDDKESFRNKKLILSAIENRIMPPWHTDTSYVRFQNEIVLSEQEKKAIELFLQNEKPYPKSRHSFKKPAKDKKTIQIAMAKPYVIPPHSEDIFTWFQSSYFFRDTTKFNRISINSSNRKSLHHCEVFATNQSNFVTGYYNSENSKTIENDTTFDDQKSSFKDNGRLLAGRFSGITSFKFPRSFSMSIYPQEGLLYYAHYSPFPVSDKDSTWIEISLCRNKKTRQVQEYGIHAFQSLLNPPFVIKANTVKTFYCSQKVEDTMAVFSVYPHAHHLCQKMLAYAITPHGDSIPLIKIDKWQFNWQWHYNYDKLKIIPKGSTIFLQATYDNTSSNIDNPNNPPQDAHLSFNSNDEMMTLFMYYTTYKKGDELKRLPFNK